MTGVSGVAPVALYTSCTACFGVWGCLHNCNVAVAWEWNDLCTCMEISPGKVSWWLRENCPPLCRSPKETSDSFRAGPCLGKDPASVMFVVRPCLDRVPSSGMFVVRPCLGKVPASGVFVVEPCLGKAPSPVWFVVEPCFGKIVSRIVGVKTEPCLFEVPEFDKFKEEPFTGKVVLSCLCGWVLCWCGCLLFVKLNLVLAKSILEQPSDSSSDSVSWTAELRSSSDIIQVLRNR